jgi:hypothetical protein
MKQDRRQAALLRIAQHRLTQGSRHQLPAMYSHEVGGLCQHSNHMQRQEVGLVNDLVEPKHTRLVIGRPFDELAHLGYDRA